MSKILLQIPKVLCPMDGVFIFVTSQTEHDNQLTSVFQRLQTAGATLNRANCEFGYTPSNFLVTLSMAKVLELILHGRKQSEIYNSPRTYLSVLRFTGMANQLRKLSPHLSEISQSLRELLSTRCSWLWEHTHKSKHSQESKMN